MLVAAWLMLAATFAPLPLLDRLTRPHPLLQNLQTHPLLALLVQLSLQSHSVKALGTLTTLAICLVTSSSALITSLVVSKASRVSATARSFFSAASRHSDQPVLQVQLQVQLRLRCFLRLDSQMSSLRAC